MPPRSSTRAQTQKSAKSAINTVKAQARAGPSSARAKRTKKTVTPEESAGDSGGDNIAEPDDGDAYDEEEEDNTASLHSDALDEDEDFSATSTKRKRASISTSPKKVGGKKKSTPRKKRKTADDDDDEDFDLEDGQEVVGVVVQAPKTGRGAYFGCWRACSLPI